MSSIVLTSSLHRGAALGRGIMVGRGVGGGDPLANVWTAFRLQSHDIKTLRGPIDYVDVTSAGTTPVNGRYYYSHTTAGGTVVYAKGLLQIRWAAPGDPESAYADGSWEIASADDNQFYYRASSPSPDASDPSVYYIAAIDGEEPGPNAAKGVEQRSYRDCIVVGGAGTAAVNGRYYHAGGTDWSGGDGRNINYSGGRWLIGLSGVGYLYRSSPADSSSPASADSWEVIGDGVDPAPTVTLIQEPQYAPLGLYRDVSFTDPADIDEQVGGWEYPGAPTRVLETNIMGQPVLRSKRGVPAVEFSNDALISHGQRVPEFTALTVLAANDSGNGGYSQIIVIGEADVVGNVALGLSASKIEAHTRYSDRQVTALGNWPQDMVTVTAVIDGSSWHLYVDGALVSTQFGAPELFKGFVSFGGDWLGAVGGVDAWNGSIIAAFGYNAADRLKVEAYCQTLKGGVL